MKKNHYTITLLLIIFITSPNLVQASWLDNISNKIERILHGVIVDDQNRRLKNHEDAAGNGKGHINNTK